MANYYAAARTNYFEVKDFEALENDLMYIPDIELHQDKEGRACILATGGDECGWPGFISRDMLMDDCDENQVLPDWILNSEDDDIDVDIAGIVSEHLVDGAVAIFMESGAEKLRYVVGFAEAINSKGERQTISLNNIYDLAADLTDRPMDITPAEY